MVLRRETPVIDPVDQLQCSAGTPCVPGLDISLVLIPDLFRDPFDVVCVKPRISHALPTLRQMDPRFRGDEKNLRYGVSANQMRMGPAPNQVEGKL